MNDLGQLEELDGLLALAKGAPMTADTCGRLIELLAAAPGRLRRVVAALSEQRDAPAIEALLALPAKTPGVVEAVFGALRCGVTRELDGQPCPRMLALEFRHSKSKRFPQVLAYAQAGFAQALEHLEVDGRRAYRVALFEVAARRGALRREARAVELDLDRLHRELLRLKGTRLWLNGWCFDDSSGLGPSTRAPLLRAWLDWAISGSEVEVGDALH